MTLLIADSCDNAFQKVFFKTSNINWVPNAGVYGGGAYFIPYTRPASQAYSGSYYIEWKSSANLTTTASQTMRFSFWFRTANSWIGRAGAFEPNYIIYNYDSPASANSGSGNPLGYNTLGIDSAGQLVIYATARSDWTNRSELNRTSNFPITLLDGNWHHIYYAVRYDLNFGNYELRVDDKIYAKANNVRTVGVYGQSLYSHNNVFRFSNIMAEGSISSDLDPTLGYYIDDLLIWDSTDNGDGFADYYVPPQKMITLRPSADTAQAQSRPSTGSTRFNLVSKFDANGQNGYVTLAPYQKDVYDLADLSSNDNVRMILVNMAYASGNVGLTANARLFLTANGFYTNSNTVNSMSQSFQPTPMIYTDYKNLIIVPRDIGNSNIAWSQTSIQSIQVGIENPG